MNKLNSKGIKSVTLHDQVKSIPDMLSRINIWELINVINRNRKSYYHISWVIKAFSNIQSPFMIKTQIKLGTKGKFFSLIKNICIKPTANIILNHEIELPYDSAIPLLGIHTEETRYERDMCTPMFIVALFIIARTWKQPSCPSADEWIRKLWYIYTMEYYSAIKKNTFESVLMMDETEAHYTEWSKPER